METKVVKNEDAPLGRNDWKGRQPRWRPSWNLGEFLILKEALESYFNRHPETRTTKEYSDLYGEIVSITQKMQTPLMATVEEHDLF